jgi:Fe-S cluster assembly protein SufD
MLPRKELSMAAETEALARCGDHFAALETQLGSAADAPLHQRRREAWQRFTAMGFPHPRDEDWRLTRLASLARCELTPAARSGAPAARPVTGAVELDGPSLVFVDGAFAPALSRPTAPPGIWVTELAPVLATRPALLAELGQHATEAQQPFTALNTAFLSSGALVEVGAGTRLAEPIHLVFLGTDRPDAVVCHPRVLVRLGAGSQATIVQTYLSDAGPARWTNAVSEVSLGPGAELDHYCLQQEGPQVFHLADLAVAVDTEARFCSTSISLGGGLARQQVRTVLAGPGAASTLRGLYLGGGDQHLAHHTLVEHRQPHGVSHQLYKGILADQAEAVFRGRILVQQAAAHTDAYQSNRNLLLSADAEVNTQPQLEIYADEVKCSHGATVGRLDDDALFYLRSRGLGEEQARQVLTGAFAGEIIDPVRPVALREYLETRVNARLAHARA